MQVLKTHFPPTASNPVAAQTQRSDGATRTETAARGPDSLPTTAMFIRSPSEEEFSAFVEEDSTDIYTSERCSPLNDY